MVLKKCDCRASHVAVPSWCGCGAELGRGSRWIPCSHTHLKSPSAEALYRPCCKRGIADLTPACTLAGWPDPRLHSSGVSCPVRLALFLSCLKDTNHRIHTLCGVIHLYLVSFGFGKVSMTLWLCNKIFIKTATHCSPFATTHLQLPKTLVLRCQSTGQGEKPTREDWGVTWQLAHLSGDSSQHWASPAGSAEVGSNNIQMPRSCCLMNWCLISGRGKESLIFLWSPDLSLKLKIFLNKRWHFNKRSDLV